jgi:hypothetical protein
LIDLILLLQFIYYLKKDKVDSREGSIKYILHHTNSLGSIDEEDGLLEEDTSIVPYYHSTSRRNSMAVRPR